MKRIDFPVLLLVERSSSIDAGTSLTSQHEAADQADLTQILDSLQAEFATECLNTALTVRQSHG